MYLGCDKVNFNRLKDLREDKDLNQSEIAKVLKTTQQQYSKYEIGIRLIPIDKLNILADFYKTSIDYIVGRTNIKKPYPKNKI
ncbi:MAG TPA: helix-turn-helix transcriptional regulator [Candidatus Coprosoma intestinipullorum]|uniref:Helix-turn-helix transcriptional regulator n=1 Tax=Candidatus Coprosoma intestinipullorum TaxID=2840752 RepID=A0A9D0ZQM8_9FIRM|nr:helix-turn-helix transcriptional regulator [Candidatus Coprosoma intestinipullorum]